MIISVPKGSRIRYTDADGVERVGTVHAIERRRIRQGVITSFYHLAESPEPVAKEDISEVIDPHQLRKNVLLCLLDQDVLDNIQSSRNAVLDTSNKYGFRPPAYTGTATVGG